MNAATEKYAYPLGSVIILPAIHPTLQTEM
jgi:hypothetical protein